MTDKPLFPDFSDDERFTKLLGRVGAKPVAISIAPYVSSTEKDKWKKEFQSIGGTGIEGELGKVVKFGSNGDLHVDGLRVVAYIREHSHYMPPLIANGYIKVKQDELIPQSLCDVEECYRVHLVRCGTLVQMMNKNKFGKYVYTTRVSGDFYVNFIADNTGTSCRVPLRVCRTCLTELNYVGYQKVIKEARNQIVDEFSFSAFFQIYNSQLTTEEFMGSDDTSPMNRYSKHWNLIAFNYKEKKNFVCEECKTDLNQPDNRQFLHVHHINNRKDDNSVTNLKCVCVGCHAKYHPGMKKLPIYRKFVTEFRP